MFIKTVFFALFTWSVLGNELGCKTYEDAYRHLDDLISHDVYIIPSLIRLAFHDCVGKSCDGCLNFHDKTNYGLLLTVEKIDHIWEHGYKSMSRSDFWQLASNVALVRAGLNRGCHYKHCHFFDLQFKWGRKDCHSSPSHDHADDAGDAHGDFDEVYRVLKQFGMDKKEMVAILGAHSVGGAHGVNSGFNYNWQKHYLTFDNQYYKNLISLPFTVEDVDHDHHEDKFEFVWTPKDHHEEPLVMLNTDMCLWKDIHVSKDHQHHYTGKSTCPTHDHHLIHLDEGHYNEVHKCNDAKTADIVYDFAHHLDHFYNEFSQAWWKMVSHGCDHLEVPGKHGEKCGDCIPEHAFCVDGFEKAGQCCPGTKCVHNKCVHH